MPSARRAVRQVSGLWAIWHEIAVYHPRHDLHAVGRFAVSRDLEQRCRALLDPTQWIIRPTSAAVPERRLADVDISVAVVAREPGAYIAATRQRVGDRTARACDGGGTDAWPIMVSVAVLPSGLELLVRVARRSHHHDFNTRGRAKAECGADDAACRRDDSCGVLEAIRIVA